MEKTTASAIGLRDAVTNAIRYWEPRRIVYNLALAAVVLVHFGLNFKAPVASSSVNIGLLLFMLAVLANVVYCAAYLPDLFAQLSGLREQWLGLRWILFVVGLLFAGILTHFFAIGLFAR